MQERAQRCSKHKTTSVQGQIKKSWVLHPGKEMIERNIKELDKIITNKDKVNC